MNASLNRRQFLAKTTLAATAFTLVKPGAVRGTAANAKIQLGLIGCGNRGKWIAKFFLDHGGFDVASVTDYFKDRADEAGEKLQVPRERRYAGLSGYKRLLDGPVDAVVIETPPYFHPEQAAAAVAAGKHVFLAKPIAVDVPGCQSIAASGRKATENSLCFLVDFQTRAHPAYQEAVRRVQAGMIGKILSVDAGYHCGDTWGHMDAVLRPDPKDPERRLRAWGLDRVLSGDVITEQNIHALDVATWFLNRDPVRAWGLGGRGRGLAGDCWDHFAVTYEFPEGLFVSFSSKQVGHGHDDIMCRVYGTEGTAHTHYFGDVIVRAKDDIFNGGKMTNLYSEGVVRNIATFHDSITQGNWANPTVVPSVRSNLTTILGRMAAYRRSEVTWKQMLRANEKWVFHTKRLKA